MSRDLRLDFLRGIALLCIVYDHIGFLRGSIPFWAQVTPRFWGLTDAAEIFFFISGYVFAVSGSRTLETYGLPGAWFKSLNRAWQLYVAYVLTVLFSLGIVLTVLKVAGSPRMPAFIGEHALLTHPSEGFLDVLLLRGPTILPAYMKILLFAPLLLALARRKAWLALLVSFGLYLATQVAVGTPGGEALIDRDLFSTPGLNVYAYQLVFFTGVFLAVHPVRLPAHPALTIGAGAVVAFVAFNQWLAPRLLQLPAFAFVEELSIAFPHAEKATFGLARWLYFLVLLFLTARLLPPDGAFLRHPFARPFLVAGQNALEVYCIGAILTIAGACFLFAVRGGPLLTVAVMVLACVLNVGAAYGVRWRRRQLTRIQGVGALKVGTPAPEPARDAILEPA